MSLKSNAFHAPALSRMRSTMSGHIDAGEMPGMVYALERQGEITIQAIGESAVGGAPMREDTIFRIASMSKPVLGVATLQMVEECLLRLDDPVDDLLPELAERRVLKRREGAVGETMPASRPILLRDLLTMRLGTGVVMEWPAKFPFQLAMEKAGVAPGPHPYSLGHDAFMEGLGSLPLVHEPGDGWMYQTGYDVLGILVARAAGKPLGEVLQERIFDPLGMVDTGFFVPAAKLDRLATQYSMTDGGLKVEDEAAGGWYAGAPPFERAGAELVSTAGDYLKFCRMMLAGGTLGGVRILSRPSVELMTMDHTTDDQKRGPDAAMFLGNGGGWGFQVGVNTARVSAWTNPGRFGWDGGYGTSGWSDPKEGLIGILLTQRMMDSPQPQKHYVDFWTSAYAAISG